jgi:hypothetical protein
MVRRVYFFELGQAYNNFNIILYALFARHNLARDGTKFKDLKLVDSF